LTASAAPLRNFGPKLLLGVAAVALAVVSARDAALAHWRALKAPDPPVLLADDPLIVLRQADKMDNMRLGAPELARLDKAATEVLAASPLNSSALHYAGLYSARQGKKPGIAAIELAERVSRRDPWNQVQLLLLAAQKPDAPAALRHVDRALLGYPRSSTFLFPILQQALFEPGVQHELAKYAGQPWFPGFVRSTFDDGAMAEAAMAAVAKAGPLVSAKQRNELTRGAMARAASRRSYGEALLLAENLDPQARAPLAELGFIPATVTPDFGKLGWQLTNDSVAQAFAAADGSVDIEAGSERSHMVAERITLLPPGSYTLTQVLAYNADVPAAALSWELRCAMQAEQVLWQQDFPTTAGTTRYSAGIVIPEGCLGQRWVLTAAAGLTRDEATARIVNLSLARN